MADFKRLSGHPAMRAVFAAVFVAACSPAGNKEAPTQSVLMASEDHAEGAATIVPQEFEISRHERVKLSGERADLILDQASQILQGKDDGEDMPCPIAMKRKGPVTTFSAVNGIIMTQRDFNEVIAQPGSIHVVASIQFCGKRKHAFGCSPKPGGDIVVEASDNMDMAILAAIWAHEFGHNQNLGHRGGERYLMNDYAVEASKGVNTSECGAFMVPRPPNMVGNVFVGQQNLASTDVGEFVRRIYFDGISYDDASSFTASDLPALNEILGQQEDKPYWANAVTVIGAIGGRDASQDLIRFVQGNENKDLDADTFRAGLGAMIGLGYAANKGDAGALNFLSTKAKEFSLTPMSADTLRLDRATLSQSAILGLSLSATDQAERVFQQLPKGNDLIMQSIEINREIKSKGLSAFDREN